MVSQTPDVLPGPASIAAAEEASRLDSRVQLPVAGRERPDRGNGGLTLAKGQAFARMLPGLPHVVTAPDRGTVPGGTTGGVQGPGRMVIDGVVGSPNVGERPANVPAPPFLV